MDKPHGVQRRGRRPVTAFPIRPPSNPTFANGFLTGSSSRYDFDRVRAYEETGVRIERSSEFERVGNNVVFTHPDLISHPHGLSSTLRKDLLRGLAAKLPAAQARYVERFPERADVAGALELAASPTRPTSPLVRYRTRPLLPYDIAREARMSVEEHPRPVWFGAAEWTFFRGNQNLCRCFLGFRQGLANPQDERDLAGCENCVRNPHVSAVVGVDMAMYVQPRALFAFIASRPHIPHYFQQPVYEDEDGVPLSGSYLVDEHVVSFVKAAPDADGFCADVVVVCADMFRNDGKYGPHYPNYFRPGVFAFGDMIFTVGREGTEFGAAAMFTVMAMPLPAGMERPVDWLEHMARFRHRRTPPGPRPPPVDQVLDVLTSAATRMANTEKESTVLATLRRKAHQIMPEGTDAYKMEELVQRSVKRAEDLAWKVAVDAGRVVNLSLGQVIRYTLTGEVPGEMANWLMRRARWQSMGTLTGLVMNPVATLALERELAVCGFITIWVAAMYLRKQMRRYTPVLCPPWYVWVGLLFGLLWRMRSAQRQLLAADNASRVETADPEERAALVWRGAIPDMREGARLKYISPSRREIKCLQPYVGVVTAGGAVVSSGKESVAYHLHHPSNIACAIARTFCVVPGAQDGIYVPGVMASFARCLTSGDCGIGGLCIAGAGTFLERAEAIELASDPARKKMLAEGYAELDANGGDYDSMLLNHQDSEVKIKNELCKRVRSNGGPGARGFFPVRPPSISVAHQFAAVVERLLKQDRGSFAMTCTEEDIMDPLAQIFEENPSAVVVAMDGSSFSSHHEAQKRMLIIHVLHAIGVELLDEEERVHICFAGGKIDGGSVRLIIKALSGVAYPGMDGSRLTKLMNDILSFFIMWYMLTHCLGLKPGVDWCGYAKGDDLNMALLTPLAKSLVGSLGAGGITDVCARAGYTMGIEAVRAELVGLPMAGCVASTAGHLAAGVPDFKRAMQNIAVCTVHVPFAMEEKSRRQFEVQRLMAKLAGWKVRFAGAPIFAVRLRLLELYVTELRRRWFGYRPAVAARYTSEENYRRKTGECRRSKPIRRDEYLAAWGVSDGTAAAFEAAVEEAIAARDWNRDLSELGDALLAEAEATAKERDAAGWAVLARNFAELRMDAAVVMAEAGELQAAPA